MGRVEKLSRKWRFYQRENAFGRCGYNLDQTTGKLSSQAWL